MKTRQTKTQNRWTTAAMRSENRNDMEGMVQGLSVIAVGDKAAFARTAFRSISNGK